MKQKVRRKNPETGEWEEVWLYLGRGGKRGRRWTEAHIYQKPRKQHVYFIQVGRSGPVKIGHTMDVAKRLKEMQTGSFAKLRIVGVIEGKGRESELFLHAHFADLRLEGEWFLPSPELIAVAEGRATVTPWGGFRWVKTPAGSDATLGVGGRNTPSVG